MNYVLREKEWDNEKGEDINKTKKVILTILKDQKVSLSQTVILFNKIIEEIEDNNPITINWDIL